ncbi:hypothetical protein BKP45_15280 [Anaerobacillus alkalidiazotrophicus]|uniref:DUF4367 domain-containing protein n=1 Tax=Anaerobacillus alkalidiazotrophicus TaxID=472963 RepID=A0A1S2M2C3_9BACI|nr:DUF4367 domain-containing protein [Anaerobacillus alkalidiazotrophicus]OIJ18889.1 hypothetical protein BKP45_15280 [Anaerobacillus alkalidiazotrophicus]
MTRKKLHDLDELIQESIREEIDHTPQPPISTSKAWEQLQQRRNMKKKLKNNHNKLIYIAAAAFILITLSFAAPKSGSAFFNFTEFFHRIQDSVVQLFIKVEDTNDDLNAPSFEGYEIIDQDLFIDTISLEEAKEVTSFQIIIPSYLPENYILKDVTVLRLGDQKSDDIILNYQLNDIEFKINIKYTGGNFGFGSTFSEKDTTIEDVMIKNHPATLILSNHENTLIWTNQDFFFSIEGNLLREEMIKIAESM